MTTSRHDVGGQLGTGAHRQLVVFELNQPFDTAVNVRSSLPEISPFTCKLVPRRAVEPDGIVFSGPMPLLGAVSFVLVPSASISVSGHSRCQLRCFWLLIPHIGDSPRPRRSPLVRSVAVGLSYLTTFGNNTTILQATGSCPSIGVITSVAANCVSPKS